MQEHVVLLLMMEDNTVYVSIGRSVGISDDWYLPAYPYRVEIGGDIP